MKKMILAVLILLLLALTFPSIPSIPKVSATTTEDLRRVTPALPEDVPSEPMPENSTTEDYLNTTNPYSQINPLGEESEEEGANPLYVLVFGDEEERAILRSIPSVIGPIILNWNGWASFQLERGDEALAPNFGIDIRVLGFEEWDSDDSIQRMDDPQGFDLCDELLADKGHYLRTWYDGEWWSNYVDAIIGITAQATPEDPVPITGVAPSLNEKNQGTIFVLLKWQVYWKDDNLVQHEVSHLYYAPDHPEPQPPAPCCAMSYHVHSQLFIWEDALWWVFNNVPCVYTSYHWCTDCHGVIQQNSDRYPIRTLTISVYAESGGTTEPPSGTYTYNYGSSVTVNASPYTNYHFNYWILDGTKEYANPITVTMNSDHTLKAYFQCDWGGPGCPILSVYGGTGYVEEGLLGIHNPDGIDVVASHVLNHTPEPVEHKYLLRLTEHPQTHSYIDQVQLYTTLKNGMEIKLPLVSAIHSEDWDVKQELLLSDDVRADTLGADHNNGTSEYIDLCFVASDGLEIETFTFIIEGHNPIFKLPY